MNNVLTLIDAIEQRLALVVVVGAAAFSAADPGALSPKWAAILAAAVAVGRVVNPGVPAAAVNRAPVVAPNDPWPTVDPNYEPPVAGAPSLSHE